MDRFFTPLGQVPRRFPGPPPVTAVGFLPQKTEELDRVFSTVNFSFILKGGGHYHLNDTHAEVVAPAVIMQWPGKHAKYGPSGRWQSWQELYIVYSAEYLAEWQRRNIARLDKPMWSIERGGAWREQLDLLFRTLRRPNHQKEVDRIDRICEQLIFESASGEQKAPPSQEEEIVRMVQNQLKQSLNHAHDVSSVARKFGIAPVTFRRYWNQYVDEPSARYLMSLRIQEAQRLLLETEHSVARIARGLGFRDPLYFSRMFRKKVGISASEYRRRFHPASLEHPEQSLAGD